MPDTPSALARLRPARRRRPRRTLVTRTEVRVIVVPVVPVVPEAPGTRAERLRSGAWTLYSRWEWWLAKARTDRARRAAHPYWR